ncbi:MAG: LPS export ABC transporter permease LptG, partial [Caulobacterales bacterium]
DALQRRLNDMGFLFSALGRYLMARSLIGIAIALVSVLAAILLIDVVEQLRSIGDEADLTIFHAAGLTLLKTPMLIEQTLPFVVLAGAMIAVIGLNRSSELTAMRAAGVSAWRFLAPPVVLAAAIGIIFVMVINPIGAATYARYEQEKARLLSENPNEPTGNGVWIRQASRNEQVVVHAERWSDNGARLENVTFLFFAPRDGSLKFTRRIQAETADLRPGFWQLHNLVEAGPGVAPEHAANLALPTSIDPTELLDRFVAPATLSFWRLPGFINQAHAAGLAPVRFELKWQSLLGFPVMLAAMAGLGAVFSLRLQRLGNVARWAAFGAGIGLFLFFFGQLAAAFAVAQAVPPVVAAWSPPLTGLFTALAFVAYLEDG